MAKTININYSAAVEEIRGLMSAVPITGADSSGASISVGLEPFAMVIPAGKAHVHASVKNNQGSTLASASCSLDEAVGMLQLTLTSGATNWSINNGKKQVGVLNEDAIGASGHIELAISGSVQQAQACVFGSVDFDTAVANGYTWTRNTAGARMADVSGNGHYSIKIPFTVQTS